MLENLAGKHYIILQYADIMNFLNKFVEFSILDPLIISCRNIKIRILSCPAICMELGQTAQMSRWRGPLLVVEDNHILFQEGKG